jgi:hypothetical protein
MLASACAVGGRTPRNGVGFGDQRASGVQDLSYLHVAAGGRYGDDKPRPVRLRLGSYRHGGGTGQPVIATEPLTADLPGQRYPRRHVFVGACQLDVGARVDVRHRSAVVPEAVSQRG